MLSVNSIDFWVFVFCSLMIISGVYFTGWSHGARYGLKALSEAFDQHYWAIKENFERAYREKEENAKDKN